MMWEKVRLSEIVDTSSGGTPNRSIKEYWENGDIPWVKSGQLKDCLIEGAEEFITEKGLKSSSAKLVDKGTLLLALYGATAGKLGFLGLNATTNQAVCAIKPKRDNLINTKYLYYYLLSQRSEIIKDSEGGAQPNISQNYVNNIQIPLPPLPIQKRIAEILDTANALRRKDEALLKKYDELAQAIFIDMFGDPVKNEKGWEVKTLKSCTSKIGSGSTPIGGKTAYKEQGISLIRSMNVYDNYFKMKDLAFIDDIQAEKLKNVEVKSNDVLFNITGASVCRCTIVPEEILPARVNQHVAILRAKEELLSPKFLSTLLTTNSMKKQLLNIGIAGGAVMEAITKEQLENQNIILPPIEVQNRFANILKNLNEQNQKSSNSQKESDSLFNSLLQKAFNGELVA